MVLLEEVDGLVWHPSFLPSSLIYCGCYGTSKNRKDQLRRFFQTQVDILMVVCLRLLAAGKKYCLIYREVCMGEGQQGVGIELICPI